MIQANYTYIVNSVYQNVHTNTDHQTLFNILDVKRRFDDTSKHYALINNLPRGINGTPDRRLLPKGSNLTRRMILGPRK